MLLQRALIVLLSCGAFAVAGGAAPPKVVQTSPASGANDVDPGTVKLRVVFDQAMQPGGYSLIGGGPTFPTLDGNPRWLDGKTLEIPVRLEPDKPYQIGFNNERYQNFKSTQGEPAVPHTLKFRTAAAPPAPGTPGAPKSTGLQPHIDKSIVQLREVIFDRYSYRDLRWVDWERRFRQFEPQLRAAKSPREFAIAAAELLAAAQDPHLNLAVGNEMIPTFRRVVQPNVSSVLLSRIVPQFVHQTATVSTGRFEGDIAYVLITGWHAEDKQALSTLREILRSPAAANGLIIDVRLNSGGDEAMAGEFACHFIDQPAIYARHVIRDAAAASGFTPPIDRQIEPCAESQRYSAGVVVLTGPVVMSSAEAFVLMMKQSPRCTVIGEPTYGSSGNPARYPLACGVILWAPRWKAMKPDGSILEGQGVQPDIVVKTTPADLTTRDPLIEAALDLLRKQRGK